MTNNRKKKEVVSKLTNNVVKKNKYENINKDKVISKKSSNKKNLKFKLFVEKRKNLLLVSLLLVIDVVLIICFARQNFANYAELDGRVVFVGKTRNLLFGRNYVGLIVTLFIYFYGMLVSKILCKNKITIKKAIVLFVLILVVNMLLFYLFTNKIY